MSDRPQCSCTLAGADPRDLGLRCAQASFCTRRMEAWEEATGQLAERSYAGEVGATDLEREVIRQTVQLARSWSYLVAAEGESHPSHDRDVADAIHAVQRCVAIRIARRVNPELWRPADGAVGSEGGDVGAAQGGRVGGAGDQRGGVAAVGDRAGAGD